jgi:hypothetical protein
MTPRTRRLASLLVAVAVAGALGACSKPAPAAAVPAPAPVAVCTPEPRIGLAAPECDITVNGVSVDEVLSTARTALGTPFHQLLVKRGQSTECVVDGKPHRIEGDRPESYGLCDDNTVVVAEGDNDSDVFRSAPPVGVWYSLGEQAAYTTYGSTGAGACVAGFVARQMPNYGPADRAALRRYIEATFTTGTNSWRVAEVGIMIAEGGLPATKCGDLDPNRQKPPTNDNN